MHKSWKFLVKNFWNNSNINDFIYRNDINLLQTLLTQHINPNTTDNNGNTPLHIAAKLGNFKVVELLLQRSAMPEIRNHHNDTPIDLAKQHEILPDGAISWNHVFTLDILCEHINHSIIYDDHTPIIG